MPNLLVCFLDFYHCVVNYTYDFLYEDVPFYEPVIDEGNANLSLTRGESNTQLGLKLKLVSNSEFLAREADSLKKIYLLKDFFNILNNFGGGSNNVFREMVSSLERANQFEKHSLGIELKNNFLYSRLKQNSLSHLLDLYGIEEIDNSQMANFGKEALIEDFFEQQNKNIETLKNEAALKKKGVLKIQADRMKVELATSLGACEDGKIDENKIKGMFSEEVTKILEESERLTKQIENQKKVLTEEEVKLLEAEREDLEKRLPGLSEDRRVLDRWYLEAWDSVFQEVDSPSSSVYSDGVSECAGAVFRRVIDSTGINKIGEPWDILEMPIEKGFDTPVVLGKEVVQVIEAVAGLFIDEFERVAKEAAQVVEEVNMSGFKTSEKEFMDKRECASARVIKAKELIKTKTNIDYALSNVKYNHETKEFEKTPCYSITYTGVKEFIGIKNIFKKIFYNIFFK